MIVQYCGEGGLKETVAFLDIIPEEGSGRFDKENSFAGTDEFAQHFL